MTERTIFVKRKWQTAASTISTFEVSGTDFKGYFLERPGPDTSVANTAKRIPDGTYKLKWHNSSRPSIGRHNPLPLLYNSMLSPSRYILIHNGNKPEDSIGCLLIGASKSKDRVWNSVSMLEQLKGILNSDGIENFTLIITSCYG